MEISVLINELRETPLCTLRHYTFTRPDMILNHIKLYHGPETGLADKTLYIVKEPQPLPDDCAFAAFIFFCDPESDSLKENGNYIFVDAIAPVPDNIDFLMDLFSDDQRLEIALQPMIESLLKDYGLQKMSDTAAELLGNPFWIIDMNYNFITKPQGQISDEKIRQETELGYILDETVIALRRNKTREQIQRLNEAVSFIAEGTDRHIMMAAVKIKGITVAYINMIEEKQSFNTYHLRLMNRIAEIVGVEMQKTSYFKNNKGLMFSYFLTDLLDNRINNIQNIQKRMKTLGLQIQKYFYILAIDLHNLEFREVSLNAINEQIKYIINDCIYCTYHQHSVFLITKPESVHSDSRLISDLEQYLKDSNLTGGLSTPVTDILSARSCFDKALRAIDLGRRFTPRLHLMKYSDVILYDFISSSQQEIQISDWCNGAVSKLEQYDLQHNTVLLDTLRCYLSHNSQIAAAARELNMHQNTLRYRLEKIRQITGYSLENGGENLEMLLALKCYEYSYAKFGYDELQ